MRIALLHTSDAHNRWNEAFVSHLRALKAQHDALLLDSGDAIRAGNVAIPLRPETAWEWMLFDPPLEVARAWVARLRPEADLLIALTHIGIQRDRQLAQACPELDVILGGHSHTPTETPEQVGGVCISHAPPFCNGATLLTLVRRDGHWMLE
jgi:2',3'-cyclic-nucleotide 2'-phosphodiesterase (5'-nucleotidase family)